MLPVLRETAGAFLKRFAPNSSEPIALNLKATFDSTFGAEASAYRQDGYERIASILSGGAPTWSGEAVNLRTALQHPVVWACNGIVSGSIGFIPAVLMQKKNGAKQEAAGHPMYSAMQNAPNDEITAQGFTELLTSHCLMAGNGFAKINRRSGTGVAIELEHLLPGQVDIGREKSGQKRLVYVIKNETGATDKTYTVEKGKPQDILHLRGLGWDGVRGYSVIELGRQSIGTAIAAERNTALFWANGGRIPYLLEMARAFKDDRDFQKFRAEWEEIYANPHRAPILENGTTYKQTGLSMRDAQAIEFRQAAIAELCRWFFVSPHLVGDLSRATFSNIEQLALDFVKMTLSRWLSRWEQDFWRCVLTPDEKSAGYYLRHNIRELLRGDFKTRMEGFASALQNGHMNIDEVRDEEDRNPLPDGIGQDYHIQLNMQSVGAAEAPPSTIIKLGKQEASQ
jgi:HK97 family phage portal protein